MTIMPHDAPSDPDADLISAQLGCTPRRRRRDLRVPADLLAFLGTTRQPMRYPGWPFWHTLDQLPLGEHHHHPGPAPVIEAVRDGRVCLSFWCQHCRQRHYHGRHGACPPGSCGCLLHIDLNMPGRVECTCPAGAGDGHRGAHCWKPGSPYKRTGYVLREVAG